MIVAWLGPWQFLILAGIVVFVFGTARFGRGLRALRIGGREFRKAVREQDELPRPPDETPTAP
jgi:Sec-independent protein translocase protein TatA